MGKKSEKEIPQKSKKTCQTHEKIVTVIPVVVGVLGAAPRGRKERRKELEIRERERERQRQRQRENRNQSDHRTIKIS